MYRATLEGIAFSFEYGMDILKELGINLDIIRVGNDNLFRSSIFSTTLATLVGGRIEVVDTTGAIGAAQASGVKGGAYEDLSEAMENLKTELEYFPAEVSRDYQHAYEIWKSDLSKLIKET